MSNHNIFKYYKQKYLTTLGINVLEEQTIFNIVTALLSAVGGWGVGILCITFVKHQYSEFVLLATIAISVYVWILISVSYLPRIPGIMAIVIFVITILFTTQRLHKWKI